MAKGYTAAEKAAIFQTFPDDLKQAIGEYEPLEAKTLEQLHNILIGIRRKFDLAPWHNFTRFMKILGSGKRTGSTFERQNSWTLERKNKLSNYCNKSCQWVCMQLEVGRGSEVGSEEFYVCPSKNIFWSAATESQIQSVVVPVCSATSRKYRYVVVPKIFVLEQATKALATLGEAHGPVKIHYNVSVAEKHADAEEPKKVKAPAKEVQHKEPKQRETDAMQRWNWNSLLQKLHENSWHEQAFLRETIEASSDPGEYLETHNLYLRYKTWAFGSGYRPVSEHILNATIALIYPNVIIDRKRIGKRRPVVAYGVTWLTGQPKAQLSEEQSSERLGQHIKDLVQHFQAQPQPKQATASKEFLWMMFDMACVKLRELGMDSTIERWSKQLKSLVGDTP